MIMKKTDAGTAIALIIQGYLRANEGAAASGSPEDAKANELRQLAEVLFVITDEVDKWAENLPDHHPINAGSLDGVMPHEMAQEMVNLLGAEESRRVLESAIKADHDEDPGPEAGPTMIAGIRLTPEATALLNGMADPDMDAKVGIPVGQHNSVEATAGGLAVNLIDAVGAEQALATVLKAIVTPRQV